MPSIFTSQSSNPRWAVLTVIIGAVLSLVLPWALTHFASGISFIETGPIGDTIGGIAGPVLNFAGLLVVYFSLREQFDSNQIQIRNFNDEQQRSANENTISTAFKIIDDLRAETRRIHEKLQFHDNFPNGIAPPIDPQKFPDFQDVNYTKEPKLLNYSVTFEEATPTAGFGFQREVLEYFHRVAVETKVLRATLDMLLYLLTNSPLPLAQRMHLYQIVLAFYEPLVCDLLGGLEIFSKERESIEDLVQKVRELHEDMSNSYEAFSDLSIHDPDGNW
jgi:hypothetical protein